MAKALKICCDRSLPAECIYEAQLRAVEENFANAVSPDQAIKLEIAVLKGKLWKPGRLLRVRFMGGNPDLHDKVAKVALQWCQFANIRLEFGNDPDAEIRVAFKRGDGSWSYIGTDALAANKDQPTMNFGWLTKSSQDEEISRVVLHEFGHALGAIHEHQHPTTTFRWNEPAVLEYYMGPPNNWTDAETRFNVIDRYSTAVSQFAAFDTESIMLYPIPKAHTLDGFEVPWSNSELSDTDKQFIRTVYPFGP